MTQHVFAVYDRKAEAYTAPFPANTYGIAERMFADLVNTQGHQFNRHPEDYSLTLIGKFDDHTGKIDGSKIETIVTGLQVLHDASDSLPLITN